MIFLQKLTRTVLFICLFIWLSACGGGGSGSGSADPATTNTKCVLDSSKIGDCTL